MGTRPSDGASTPPPARARGAGPPQTPALLWVWPLGPLAPCVPRAPRARSRGGPFAGASAGRNGFPSVSSISDLPSQTAVRQRRVPLPTTPRALTVSRWSAVRRDSCKGSANGTGAGGSGSRCAGATKSSCTAAPPGGRAGAGVAAAAVRIQYPLGAAVTPNFLSRMPSWVKSPGCSRMNRSTASHGPSPHPGSTGWPFTSPSSTTR